MTYVVAEHFRHAARSRTRPKPLDAITVQAVDRAAALAQVPPYVADRTVADEVREVPIP